MRVKGPWDPQTQKQFIPTCRLERLEAAGWGGGDQRAALGGADLEKAATKSNGKKPWALGLLSPMQTEALSCWGRSIKPCQPQGPGEDPLQLGKKLTRKPPYPRGGARKNPSPGSYANTFRKCHPCKRDNMIEKKTQPQDACTQA